MQVTLMASTPHAIKVAFTAIRTCYSANDFNEIWDQEYEKYTLKNNDHLRLIKQIVNHGHTSTLEHISFTFSIQEVSRTLLAQLTRHRIGFSYSVQSQRYVKFDQGNDFQSYIPEKIRDNEEAIKIYQEAMHSLQGNYDELRKLGIPAEDARYLLPNAATTNMVMTCNLRAFLDFYKKRNKTTHAQYEIAELAEVLKDLIIEKEEWTSMLFE